MKDIAASSTPTVVETNMTAIRLLMPGLAFAASPPLAAPDYTIRNALTGTDIRPLAFDNGGDFVFQDIDPASGRVLANAGDIPVLTPLPAPRAGLMPALGIALLLLRARRG